jgi:hypothetical protein
VNQRLLCVLLVMFTAIAWASQAWASTLSVAGEPGFSLPYTGAAYDISADGNLDWIVANKNQKDATNIIATYYDTNMLLGAGSLFVYDDNGMPDWAPAFAYTGGRGNTSATYQRADYLYDGTVTDIALPAGRGTVSVWWTWGQTNPGDAHITFAFDDGTSYTSPDGFNYVAPRKTVISWQTDVPQTLHFSSDVPAGVWAMAVSQVPEPGTMGLLACGLFGAIAYAWRKRK